MTRKSISKKTRFEVFKRDGFKCQYCGAMAPDVLLEVDHIEPVSKGGGNDVLNYVTACKGCNAGKSDRTLDDSSAVKVQQAQLLALQERREQLEMMLKWRNGMKDIETDQVSVIADAWEATAIGWHLNENGQKVARRLLKKYGLQSVLDAIDTAGESYLQMDEDGRATMESVETAWKKVGGICALNALPEDHRRLYYVRGILNKRLSFVDFKCIDMMKVALDEGTPIEDIEREARTCRNWSAFRDWLQS